MRSSSRNPEGPKEGAAPALSSNGRALFISSDSARTPPPEHRAVHPSVSAVASPASAPTSPARSPAPEAFASREVTALLQDLGLPTVYRKPSLMTARNGVIVTHSGQVTLTYPKQAQAKSSFVLYSFVTYNETAEAAATFAAPVYTGFDSRHPSYLQYLGLDKNKITNGGEIIFEVKPDGSMEVAFWTDKTGTFFENMFLNRLKIHSIDSSELEKIKNKTEKALAAKAKALAEISNYCQTLPAESYIAVKTWEDVLCNYNDNGLLTDSTGARGAAALFEQQGTIYQLKTQVADLDLSQLPEDALRFVTTLLYKSDQELAARTIFSALSR